MQLATCARRRRSSREAHTPGRTREAAIQLRAAADALEAELAVAKDTEKGGGALENLMSRKGELHDLAAAAVRGQLDDEQTSTVTELLAHVERALRRRRHAQS